MLHMIRDNRARKVYTGILDLRKGNLFCIGDQIASVQMECTTKELMDE